MNLLKETLGILEEIKHTTDDIHFIGSGYSGHRCSWGEFIKLADQDYDNGFGGQEVASDLVIVFHDDSWLSRSEYDGSECWDYNKVPKQVTSKDTLPIENLFTGDSLRTG